jgi:hypothetical protein
METLSYVISSLTNTVKFNLSRKYELVPCASVRRKQLRELWIYSLRARLEP